MTFGHLYLLWLLLLLPILVVAYAFDGQRRRRVLERIGHLPMIRRMTASSSPAARRVRAILTVGAVGCLAAALARPQLPGRAKLTESRGLDLVVALDFSRSMLAKDIYPTRLDRAKRELDHLIDTLKGDRVGLVAFAGETLSYPLTIDYEAAKLFWRDLGPDDMPVGGTDLGRAIRAGDELLLRGKKPADKRKGAQVLLLLTDGEDTEGQGQTAAKEAAALGIRIYTLGIGSGERPFVQLTDAEGKSTGYLTGNDGEPVRVGLDEGALRQIAASTGGEYVALDTRRFGVERVQKAIAGLERTQEEARFEREPDDIGRWFFLPAFILLLIEASIRERKRVRAVKPAAVTPAVDLQKAAVVFLMLFPFVTGFDLFLRRDPNVEEGNRQLAAGKAEEALKAYDAAATALPDEPIVRFDRGAALYQLGKFPEAQKEFQRAAESHEPALKADAYYNMGNSLMKQERYKDALDAYKHTLGVRPDDRRAKWNLELALRRMKEEEQKKQQQQNQNQNQDQQQNQDQKQAQNQQDQKQQDQKPQDQKQQDQKPQEQKQDAQKPPDPKQDQKKQEQASAERERQKAEAQKAEAQKAKEAPKDIDKQDAEAVLDALERVEPTVQKELARRRAGNRRPVKDW
jgi:Ca-activated chloride channel family protein